MYLQGFDGMTLELTEDFLVQITTFDPKLKLLDHTVFSKRFAQLQGYKQGALKSNTMESCISKLLNKKTLISKQEIMLAWITLYHKSHVEQ